MTIEHKDGDLLTETGLDAICHQCNCFKTMGAGLAAAIAKQYPEAMNIDRNSLLAPYDRLGAYTRAKSKGPDGKPILIFNLYGQLHYGTGRPQTDYPSLEKAMKAMREYLMDKVARAKGHARVGIPHGIGCGLAGGDWKIVEEMIEKVFGQDKCIVAVIVRKI